MNKFLKVAVATATVFAVQDVCSATAVNSCSKSGFYLSGAIKGKRQQANFTINEDLKPVADRVQSILIERVTAEQEAFRTANDAAANNATTLFSVNVNNGNAGHYGIPLNDTAHADFAKNFPALRRAAMLGGLAATANNVVNVVTHFGATHLEYANNTWHIIAANNASHFGVDVLNAFKDNTKFNKWLESAKTNSGKNYATLPSAKYEYSEGKKWSLGAELSIGWEQRFGDVVLNIGGVLDFMFAGNKVSCADTGVVSANDNSNNNSNNNNNKGSNATTNEYGIDVVQKPSFGAELGVAYNATRKFSIGAGADVWYKRYEVSTNKMADLFILKEGSFYGDLVKDFGGNLETYNKDALATGIAENSVKANGWVISPYVKLRYDFNQHCGMFLKVGYDINKTVLKADSSFGTLKIGGFHAGLGVVAVI